MYFGINLHKFSPRHLSDKFFFGMMLMAVDELMLKDVVDGAKRHDNGWLARDEEEVEEEVGPVQRRKR